MYFFLLFRWWQLPYFWAGIKMYDLVSGRQLLKSSYVVGKKKALELFPMLKKDKLCGAIIYYDGESWTKFENSELFYIWPVTLYLWDQLLTYTSLHIKMTLFKCTGKFSMKCWWTTLFYVHSFSGESTKYFRSHLNAKKVSLVIWRAAGSMLFVCQSF